MKYEVIGPIDVTLYGVVKEFSVINNQQFKEIPLFWAEVMQNNTFQELLKHMDNWGVLALSYGYNPETSTFKYMIGIKSET
jgi:predicted transcriptional regulator YdeE